MIVTIKPKELTITPTNFKDVKDFIEKHHYSHNVNGVKIDKCFAVRFNGELCGGVIYGSLSTTAWKKFADSEEKVLELRRLVLLDEVGKNAESYVVSRTIKWIKQHRPEVKVIVAYADPMYKHDGTIYRASNFEYLGISGADKGYKDPDTGKVYHSRALRTKGDNNKYKPFVVELRKKYEEGKLEVIDLLGKHCYVFKIKESKFHRPYDTKYDKSTIDAWI
jgi:hypothetical protein